MNVLLKPHITEKSLIEASRGRYTFVVDKRSTKPVIVKSLKEHFNVDVIGVQTRVVKSEAKVSRTNRRLVLTKSYKKAVVTLKPGQKIDIFEVGSEASK